MIKLMYININYIYDSSKIFLKVKWVVYQYKLILIDDNLNSENIIYKHLLTQVVFFRNKID